MSAEAAFFTCEWQSKGPKPKDCGSGEYRFKELVTADAECLNADVLLTVDRWKSCFPRVTVISNSGWAALSRGQLMASPYWPLYQTRFAGGRGGPAAPDAATSFCYHPKREDHCQVPVVVILRHGPLRSPGGHGRLSRSKPCFGCGTSIRRGARRRAVADGLRGTLPHSGGLSTGIPPTARLQSTIARFDWRRQCLRAACEHTGTTSLVVAPAGRTDAYVSLSPNATASSMPRNSGWSWPSTELLAASPPL